MSESCSASDPARCSSSLLTSQSYQSTPTLPMAALARAEARGIPRALHRQYPTALRRASTRSVRSQVKSGSSRPKWPYAAVCA